MKWKNFSIAFLLAQLFFLCINTISAQGLDFYSRIDDAGDSLAGQLTTRHLQDYGTFRNFWKNCRGEVAWLDTKPIDQALLEEVSIGNLSKLVQLSGNDGKNVPNTDEIQKLSNCLATTYLDLQERALSEQNTLENVNSVGVYMDGSTKNSEFDIIKDIDKINAIIFTVPFKYEGVENNSEDLLKKFLNGDKPNVLTNESETTGNTKAEIVTIGGNNSTNKTITGQNTTQHTALPWQNICNPDGTTSVSNMVDQNFMRDLNATLSGNNFSNYNTGVDYSQNTRNNTQGQNSENNNDKSLLEKYEDFANKLPCNGIFCITIGTRIENHDLLKGGNSNAIETILDKHIKKTEKISWSDLSAQKMTNNTFQLPFLNIKFKSKVAGGAVFVHNQPQVTKKLAEENTEKKREEELDLAIRCAARSASVSTDANTSSAPTGAIAHTNQATNSETFANTPVVANPVETSIANGQDCQTAYRETIRAKHYSGFSTQVNELQAFSDAMNDIIRQIIETERRLDGIPVR